MSEWDMDGDVVIIDGLNFDSVQRVSNAHKDPFKKDWKKLRSSKSLDKNFRRRSDRKVQKDHHDYGAGDASSKQLNPSAIVYNGYGMYDVVEPPYDLYRVSEYYSTHPYNHAAVDTKAANMVGLGYQWKLTDLTVLKLADKKTEQQRQTATKKIERAKIQMDLWLDSLNEHEDFTIIMNKVVTDLHALGNGYVEIGRKSNGEVGYLGHIPATTLRVRRKKDGYVQIIGDKAVFFNKFGIEEPGYNPITTDPMPNQIIHFKEYCPSNSFYGVPDIVAAGQAAFGDQLAQQYNIDYFENKAVPRYVVYVKGAKLSSDSERRLFEFMQNNLKGNNHRTLLIPLPPDNEQTKVEFKMEAIEAGVQEGSFGKYHQANTEDILAAHQVPLSKIGMGDGSLAGTLASDRTFKEQVARPGQRLIEKRLNAVVSEVTDMLKIKFNELTLTDENAQSQIDEKYLRNQVVTPNEIREKLGLPARDGGDSIIELNPRQAADAENEREGSDSRARDRTNNASDSDATVRGRNPKGEGRSTST